MFQHAGDDEFFFIAQVLFKQRKQAICGIGVGICAVPGGGVAACNILPEGVGTVGRAEQRVVDDFVVVFEQVEAVDHAPIEAAKTREIVGVLDMMVTLKMLQILSQPRHEVSLETCGIRAAFTEIEGGLLQCTPLLAKGVVYLQPESGEFAVVGMRAPLWRRVLVAQVGDFGRNRLFGDVIAQALDI